MLSKIFFLCYLFGKRRGKKITKSPLTSEIARMNTTKQQLNRTPSSSSSSSPSLSRSKKHNSTPIRHPDENKIQTQIPTNPTSNPHPESQTHLQEEAMNSPNRRTRRPKRIILIRHGESEGNLNTAAYTTTPDYKIPLTQRGCNQAYLAGSKIRKLIGEDFENDWRVYFHVSPYERTRGTLREIGKSFPKKRIIGVREECRIREQDFGNFQVEERMKVIKETREKFGRFFYRFPEGESAADVFDRVSSFLESLWRDMDMNRLNLVPSHDLNIIIISHGLTLRVFLMKWFKWTVEQFEYLNNFSNCEFRVMQLGHGGEYSLAIQHSDEEMQEWGLSPEMIADQKWRAKANRGEWNGNCRWYLEDFFDEFADSDKSGGESDD